MVKIIFGIATAAWLTLVSAGLSYSKVLDGAQLYEANCARCHNALAESSKRCRTAKRIESAINANIGGMGIFKKLNKKEVEAIAAALSKPSSGQPCKPPIK